MIPTTPSVSLLWPTAVKLFVHGFHLLSPGHVPGRYGLVQGHVGRKKDTGIRHYLIYYHLLCFIYSPQPPWEAARVTISLAVISMAKSWWGSPREYAGNARSGIWTQVLFTPKTVFSLLDHGLTKWVNERVTRFAGVLCWYSLNYRAEREVSFNLNSFKPSCHAFMLLCHRYPVTLASGDTGLYCELSYVSSIKRCHISSVSIVWPCWHIFGD